VEYSFPPVVTSKKELLQNVKKLIGTGEWFIVPVSCKKGDGGPGRLLERLVGSDGRSKAIADNSGVDVKFHSGGSLLTLAHLEVNGGNDSVLPMVRKFGTNDPIKHPDGLLRFYRTVTDTSPFRIIRSKGKVIVRPKGGGPEVFWEEDALLGFYARKLAEVVLVQGKIKNIDGVKHVRYDSATLLTRLKATDFLNAIGGKYVLVDFDVRETTPGGEILRNRGTKLRIKLKDIGELWGKIEEIKKV
jgi:hypothetical protein